ncbi:MAG TPA: hypothetical protein VMV29_02705 [Ktedonobacterales bacterium]|nr:hypothetical protein [Ktedonobacterales bacterium]
MSPEQSSVGPESPLSAADPTPSSQAAPAETPVTAPADIAVTPGAPPAATAAPGMVYPPYAPFPVYPPPPELYQAPLSQPTPAMPAPMSVPLPYGPPYVSPYATYQAPAPGVAPAAPISIRARRRSAVWPIVLTVVGSLLVVALVVGGLYALVTLASHTFSRIAPSSAPVSITGYTTPLPGQCDTQHPEFWQNQDNTNSTCTSSALRVTNPGNAKTIAEVSFQPPELTFPTAYTVSVDVASVANACAGLTVLRHNYTGYGLFVCPNGSWEWNIYSATGVATRENSSGVPSASSYHVEVEVTPHQVSLLINGKNQLTTSRLSTFTTDFLGLTVEPDTNTLDATADFSNFDYEQS